MPISFNQALGVHESALKLRAQRAELLSNNLSNADTPGFKARDIDFTAQLMKSHENTMSVTMKTTTAAHMGADVEGFMGANLLYRTPNQPSIDGNTVEDQVEHAAFMKNALDFQASFMLLNNKFKGLTKALRGD